MRHSVPSYRPFAITRTQIGDESVIALAGELDLASADRLAREVHGVLGAGAAQLVLDLRDVDFIDSTGLRVLLSLRNDAKRNRHGLSLIPPAADVRRVFEITVTQGLFDWRTV
jgi:anti-anti-sigma factor